MVLSRECEYAVQTLLHLAKDHEREFVQIRELSDQLNIPFFYLSKIMLKLVKSGILFSHKGPRGGIRFTQDPADISIYDIIVAVDSALIFEKCVLGLPKCDGEHPCAVHDKWKDIREGVEHFFRQRLLLQIEPPPKKRINKTRRKQT